MQIEDVRPPVPDTGREHTAVASVRERRSPFRASVGLAVDSLRSTLVAISAPMEPPAATESVPRAKDPGDAGRWFGQRVG